MNQIITNRRFCVECKLNQTYIHKDGCEDWYVVDNGFVCSNCYNKNRRQKFKEVLNKRVKFCQKKNPNTVKLAHSKRIRFLGTHIHIPFNPRKGICVQCGSSVSKGEIKHTHLHHLKYNPIHPEQNTIELCPSCHAKETWKKRKGVKVYLD
jgi:hypothetical protein